ncbi:MAG TPA: peptidoglycan editing factor PgeF [Candidatus Binataceae bacterium]|nr:peptidoglycan editing factor PgeF [Candidatus Binataceae bacterium]
MTNSTDSSTGKGAVPILRAWDDESFYLGFVGRLGGASAGPYASMNLSQWVGDQSEAVDSNWEALKRELSVMGRVTTLNQTHGVEIHQITSGNAGERLSGDGMVTTEPGIALGIFTADCVPILMADKERRVIGALHAGWRGLVAGIVNSGLSSMNSLGARTANMQIAMGPSIGLCCFEVDASLGERFAREIPGAVRHRRAGLPGKAYLDLRGIIKDQFESAGVELENIWSIGPCTKCESDKFFSRRAAGGRQTGLQLSFIGMKDAR